MAGEDKSLTGRPTLFRRWARRDTALRVSRLARPLLTAFLAVLGAVGPASVRAEPDPSQTDCYATAAGALEVCRSGGEPEGVFYATPSCRFAYDVQILRLKARGAPGPLQVVHHAEPPREARGRRGEAEACRADLRAADMSLGGAVRTGRLSEQLALAMPPTGYRFYAAKAQDEAKDEAPRRRGGRRGREAPRDERPPAPPPAAIEGSAGRDPMTVAGRDWAGDDYHYLFMIASEAVGEGRRHVLIQARTLDFESLDLRARTGEGDAVDWAPFGQREPEPRRRRGRPSQPPAPALAPVLDEAGKPVTGNCAAPSFESRGLVGSISVVGQVYHYFYADVLPSDCGEPPARRRMGLYLRTSRDVTADRAWSSAQLVVEGLPPDTLVRVGKAKGMERWAIAYSCYRPANAAGGPVADLCLQVSADLSVAAIRDVRFFAEPASAARSPAYLGLRSGGDGSGRYGRDGFFWMTDRYGNLDTPAVYPGKGGLVTWLDRLAPRADGSEGSTLYGRPVYWSTFTLRPR